MTPTLPRPTTRYVTRLLRSSVLLQPPAQGLQLRVAGTSVGMMELLDPMVLLVQQLDDKSLTTVQMPWQPKRLRIRDGGRWERVRVG